MCFCGWMFGPGGLTHRRSRSHRRISHASLWAACRSCPLITAAVCLITVAALHVRGYNSSLIKTSLRKARMWFPPPASRSRNEGIPRFVLRCHCSQKWGLGWLFPASSEDQGTGPVDSHRQLLQHPPQKTTNHLYLFLFSDGTPAGARRNKWIITLRIRRNLSWFTRRMRKRIL